MEPPGPSQASSHFPLEPIPASVLADREAARRNAIRAQGPCRTGCRELDEYVLMGGGLERGCVVGVSAEDEDAFGLVLGLQVIVCALLNDEAGADERALIITPRPAGVLLTALRDGIRAELASRSGSNGAGGDRDARDEMGRVRACLDRVMLSCVFDVDGVWESLAEVDRPTRRSPSPGLPPLGLAAVTLSQRPDAESHVLEPEMEVPGGDKDDVKRVRSPSMSSSTSSSLSPPPPSSSPAPSQTPPRAASEIGDSQEDEAFTPPATVSQGLGHAAAEEAELQPERANHQEAEQQQQQQQQQREVDEREESDNNKNNDYDNNNKNDNVNDSGEGSRETPLPSIILVTHFSSLLTGLFAQREKSAAHTALQLLGAHLRHLSRALPSNPLILLLNSTGANAAGAGAVASGTPSGGAAGQISATGRDPSLLSSSFSSSKPLDASLRSVFLPAALPLPGYAAPPAPRRSKPAFGLVFSQLLDLHLLCTRVALSPSSNASGRSAGLAQGPRGQASSRHVVTVVEVLLDEIGVWQGKRGRRPRREQRWAPVHVVGGRVVDASFVAGKAAAHPGDGGDDNDDYVLRLPGGFGGRRA